MNFKRYSLNVEAFFEGPVDTLYPREGWQSKTLSPSIEFACFQCGAHTISAISKAGHDVSDIPKNPTDHRNRKPRDYVQVNRMTECCRCRAKGYVNVVSLTGMNLDNGGSTTMMLLDVAEVSPMRVTQLPLEWTAKLQGASVKVTLDGAGKGEVLTGNGLVGRVRVMASLEEA